MANWDQLLPELLIMIVRKVDLYEDVVAFRGVCKSWRSVAVKGNLSHPSYPVQPPWLMLAEKEPEADFRGFVSLSKGGMVLNLELPEARGKRCIGSMGWLITIDEGGEMELLHPLARTRISLPHLRTYRFFEKDIEENSREPMGLVSRATISASPSATDDYAVMLIVGYRSDQVLCKPGDKAWTHVEGGPYLDVIYHKKFYAVDAMANIVACDLQGLNPTTLEIVGSLRQGLDVAVAQRRQVYFVECDGCLLLVKKLMRWSAETGFTTSAYKVVKASDSTRLSKWQEVNDLGGTSIFVGHNTAICVHSPGASGVKANCIYFTDDYVDWYRINDDIITRGKDMGIYNMESRKVEPLYCGTSVSEYCPPIWVSPSF